METLIKSKLQNSNKSYEVKKKTETIWSQSSDFYWVYRDSFSYLSAALSIKVDSNNIKKTSCFTGRQS